VKLTNLTLTNFRRFDHLEVTFDPSLTVIAARNGRGKTSVLEAAGIALGPFVGGFDHGAWGTITPQDAHYRVVGDGPENEQAFPVVIEARFVDPAIEAERALTSGKHNAKPTRVGAKDLNQYAKRLQEKVREGEIVTLPVICYYSSKRLWLMHRDSSRKSEILDSRTAGYQDCLSELSSFNQLHNWLRSASLAVAQAHLSKSAGPYSGMEERLRGISRAVDSVFEGEGWSGFRFDLVADTMVMSHPDHGELPLAYLSDGVRAMATMVADLAQRCSQINGHLGADAAMQTPGIVLIDEVDLHLHPAWQQRILSGLREAFPLVQFIVSTHSPQVLSTVDSSQIRVVFENADGDWCAEAPTRQVLGRSSAEALGEVMGVNPTPSTEESRKVDAYTEMIELGEHDSAAGKQLYEELQEIYGSHNPVMIRIDHQIRFQKLKERVAAPSPAPGSQE